MLTVVAAARRTLSHAYYSLAPAREAWTTLRGIARTIRKRESLFGEGTLSDIEVTDKDRDSWLASEAAVLEGAASAVDGSSERTKEDRGEDAGLKLPSLLVCVCYGGYKSGR